MVLSDTAHPAVDAVIRSERALLIDRVVAIDATNLIPSYTADTGQCLDRLVGHQRLVTSGAAKFAIGKTPRWSLPIGQDVQEPAAIRNAGFRQTVASIGRQGACDHAAGEV